MTATAAVRATPRSIGAGVRAMAWRHPEWWVLALCAAAWASWAARPDTPMVGLCLGLSAAPAQAAGAWLRSGVWRGPAGDWTMMVGAMMLPMALLPARFAAFASLWPRRHLAIAEVLAGFTAIWLATGAALLPLLALAAPYAERRPVAALALALAAAIAWQLTPLKAAALRACHRRPALPPRGWAADAACLRFGAAQGWACVGACWPLMLCPMLASHSLALGLALAVISFTERILPPPVGRWPVAAVSTIAGAALLAAAAGRYV